MIIRLKIAILIATVFLSSCVMSNYHFREGIKNFKIQNYREAFVLLMPAAEKGQCDAQYAIGYMYYYGQGVVEDRKKAWYWINLAANQGQPDAVLALKILSRQIPPRLKHQ